MHKDMLPECEDQFEKIDNNINDLKDSLYGPDGYLTNHIPSQINDTRKFIFKSVWGMALTIITVLGGIATTLIILISKG